jgi:hypothetical protein
MYYVFKLFHGHETHTLLLHFYPTAGPASDPVALLGTADRTSVSNSPRYREAADITISVQRSIEARVVPSLSVPRPLTTTQTKSGPSISCVAVTYREYEGSTNPYAEPLEAFDYGSPMKK